MQKTLRTTKRREEELWPQTVSPPNVSSLDVSHETCFTNHFSPALPPELHLWTKFAQGNITSDKESLVDRSPPELEQIEWNMQWPSEDSQSRYQPLIFHTTTTVPLSGQSMHRKSNGLANGGCSIGNIDFIRDDQPRKSNQRGTSFSSISLNVGSQVLGMDYNRFTFSSCYVSCSS